jgi:hypothetical protein
MSHQPKCDVQGGAHAARLTAVDQSGNRHSAAMLAPTSMTARSPSVSLTRPASRVPTGTAPQLAKR